LNNEINDELFNFILDNVKLLLNIQELNEDSTDEQIIEYNNVINILTLYINKICKEIMIKTNRNKFPEDLKYLIINLTIDAYNQYINETSNETNQVVQSMSETGRSVNFGTPENAKVKFQLILQKQLEDNEKQINRYKLLYKTGCDRDE
jgi:hypothetical protein